MNDLLPMQTLTGAELDAVGAAGGFGNFNVNVNIEPVILIDSVYINHSTINTGNANNGSKTSLNIFTGKGFL